MRKASSDTGTKHESMKLSSGGGRENGGDSVMSPASSIDGTIMNSGGLPETMTVAQIFENLEPPPIIAKNSVEGLGSEMSK